MSIRSSVITLSSAPQTLGSSSSRRTYVEMRVVSGTAYIGGSDVTTGTGIPWTASDGPYIVFAQFLEDTTPGESYYVVGTGEVRVMEDAR